MKKIFDILVWATLYFLITPLKRAEIVRRFGPHIRRPVYASLPWSMNFPRMNERRAIPALSLGIGTLVSPLGLVTWSVIDKGINPVLISSLSTTSLLFWITLTYTFLGRIRLSDTLVAVMGVSMVIAFVSIAPALAVGEVTNRFLAASVIYGVCLALFVTAGSTLYMLTNILRPRRWYEVGA